MSNNRPYQVWLIATLKGGVRKSTTAMFLAFVLAKRGKNVLVLDADIGTQGVTDWTSRVYADGGSLPFDVVQWAHSVGPLVPFAMKKAAEIEPDIVIIDVGGEAPDILKQAAILADIVVSPTGPEQAEVGRVGATQALLNEEGIRTNVLLTRVPEPGKGAAKDVRRSLVKAGFTVLEAEVRQNRDMYSHVWGTEPDDYGVYEHVADELLATEGKA
jgi:cellulose biosynthesis protein BcsQ